MSLRYTGEATMDQPALRDVERWKDKIEVRLDNRQVFFLFFGSAMVACMLFVLGVIVGKRLETRGRAEAPELEDPLAVLDRFGGAVAATAPAPLAFPRTLIGGGTTTVASGKSRASSPERAVEKAARLDTPVAPKADPVEKLEPAPAKATLASTVSVPSLAKPAPAPAPDVAASPVPVPSRKLAALPRPLTGPAAAGAPVSGKPATVVTPNKPAVAAASPTKPSIVTAPVAKPALPAVPASKTAAAAAVPASKTAAAAAVPASKSPTSGTTPGEKGKGRFLLQLSSFQDRAEADAFARKFAGQNAYVVASEIPGKGTWYRVRVGSYGTMQEATAAKANFERDHNVIAYVAGSGPVR